jgi:hypothetical protein
MDLPMAEPGPMHYAKLLVKKASVTHCFGMAIFRRLANSKMRNPTKKFLTLLLALAVACLPLQAFACTMDQAEQMDHSAMDMSHMDHDAMDMGQMDHQGGTDSNCCDPETATSSGECAALMHCGACTAGTSINFPLPQSALISLQATPVENGSGEIAPSHASPPYHPPNLS